MAMVSGRQMIARSVSSQWRRCRHAAGIASISATARAAPETVPQMPAFDYTPVPYTGPLANEILEKRRRFMNPSIVLFYKKHVSALCLSLHESLFRV